MDLPQPSRSPSRPQIGSEVRELVQINGIFVLLCKPGGVPMRPHGQKTRYGTRDLVSSDCGNAPWLGVTATPIGSSKIRRSLS
jgi:hypothetical protein